MLNVVDRKAYLRHCVACAVLALTIASLVACGGGSLTLRRYAGPARSPDRIAILEFYGQPELSFVFLDGQRLGPVDDGAELRVEMLPGPHQLDVIDPLNPRGRRQRARFTGEAGRLYAGSLSRFRVGGDGPLYPEVHDATPASKQLFQKVSVRIPFDE